MVTALETILRGDPRKGAQAKIAAERIAHAQQSARSREYISMQIVKIMRDAELGAGTDQIRAALEELFSYVIDGQSISTAKAGKAAPGGA
jgi:hypothetical protein